MEYEKLVNLVKDQPVFETGILLSGDIDPGYLRKQISQWVDRKKIIQLKRGLYALSPPYQKVKPHPFLIANRLKSPSYVSFQSALAYYDLIPEYSPITISATTKRPGEWKTPLGTFEYHHVKTDWFSSYNFVNLSKDQSAYIAIPEKALLDLVLLTPQADSLAYLEGLRLQNLEVLDLSIMRIIVKELGKPKLLHFLNNFECFLQEVWQEYKVL